MFGKEQGEHVNGENGELQKNGENLQDWPGKWPFYKMEVCEWEKGTALGHCSSPGASIYSKAHVRFQPLLAQDQEPWAVHIRHSHPKQPWDGSLRGRRGFQSSSRCPGPDSIGLNDCHKQMLSSPLWEAPFTYPSTSRCQANRTAYHGVWILGFAAYVTLGKLNLTSLCFSFPIWKTGMVTVASPLPWEAGWIIKCVRPSAQWQASGNI